MRGATLKRKILIVIAFLSCADNCFALFHSQAAAPSDVKKQMQDHSSSIKIKRKQTAIEESEKVNDGIHLPAVAVTADEQADHLTQKDPKHRLRLKKRKELNSQLLL
ncbi:hypothetical protein VQ056_29630 [Paenibacillus sp. JTLBN-2024]